MNTSAFCLLPFCWWFLLDHRKADQQWSCAISEVFHQTLHIASAFADIFVFNRAENVCNQIFFHYKKLSRITLAE